MRITLIDRNPYSTFKPLLFQVANGALNAGDITFYLRSTRSTVKNARFVLGELAHVNTDEKTIELTDGRSMKYDYLVLAGGTNAAFFGIPGAEEHTLPLYSRDQALDIRDRFYGLLDGLDALESTDHFRVIVAGGGPTGVETAGSLAEIRNDILNTLYPALDPSQVEIDLVDMAPTVLGPFAEDTQQRAAAALRARGVELWLGKAVKAVEEGRIKLQDSQTKEETWYDANMVIWSSGVGVEKAVGDWGIPQGRRGRIPVDDHMRVIGVEGVYAAGDMAQFGERGLPQLAQPALQTGRHVARHIAAILDGRAIEPFEYQELGTMAFIGTGDAVAELPHLPHMDGLAAWIVWQGVHVMQLKSWRERFATAVNLASRYIFQSKAGDFNMGDYQQFSQRVLEGKPYGTAALDKPVPAHHE
ncbi:NAD(P)/FAD-dependent oxidoreductase [Neoactinobaculum massilliense]|uniref:NAD(P)/FAD-dependent oxidoreductase n=1 Tax=Neoactinobaculum massilliense TaxID=2364794 RepID=UPI001F155708|nr:NAD(P)/FAD-dependent oxidoreductase [Neoactinobaculum massilliense]